MHNTIFKSRYIPLLAFVTILLLISTDASAALDNHGVLDSVLEEFKSSAASWMSIFFNAATWLFWTLVAISMIWTFGFMALRQADLGEFFAELMRFTIFTGFFWWLLKNGPDYSLSIIDSLTKLGGQASGIGANNMFTPSSIVDVGFVVFGRTLAEGSWWTSPIDSLICAIAGLGILFVCALIAINLLMLLITAWVLAYGGVFILGFGGSRWTSDIAISYYKHLLGVALQIMVMVLLIGVGWSVIDSTMSKMSEGLELAEMGVLFVVVLCVYVLANKIPPLLGGIVTGPTGGPPIGQYGGMAAAGAAGAALGATAAGITMTGNKTAALIDRFRGNQDDDGGGADLTGDSAGTDFGGDSVSGDGAGASEPSTGNTPYAEAGGFANRD